VGDVNYDVVVVGAGVVGLASAWALAQHDLRVAVVDDEPAMGSSFAAAGMLAPGAETTPEHAPLTAMSLDALARWPQFAADLSNSAEREVQVTTAGSLFVGWNSADRRELARYFTIAAQSGIEARSVRRVEDAYLFTGLSPRVEEGGLVAADAFVEPEDVLAALLEGSRRAGVSFVADRVIECESISGCAVAQTANGAIRAACGIVATGFQERPFTLLSSSNHKLRPVRGVTLRLVSDATELPVPPMIRGVVDGRTVYVIRGRDGSIIVGASSDESANLIVETGAVRRLLDDATLLIPELDDAHFIEARVGLRPASSGHLPFFEALDGHPWAWSSGHYRHGFLLAPIAAERAAQFARGQLQ
jgi:glycine oxidase